MSLTYCERLEVKTSDTEACLKSLASLPASDVSNGLIHELLTLNVKKKLLPWAKLKCTLANLYAKDWSRMSDAYFRNTFQAVKAEKDKIRNSKKDVHTRTEIFFSTPWKPPSLPVKRKLETDSETVFIDNNAHVPAKIPKFTEFVNDVQIETNFKLASEIQTLKDKVSGLELEIDSLKTANVKLQTFNFSCKKKIASWNPKRLNQALKRKVAAVQHWRKKYNDHHRHLQNITNIKEQLRNARSSLSKLRIAKGRTSVKQKTTTKHTIPADREKRLIETINQCQKQLSEKKNEVISQKKLVSFLENKLDIAQQDNQENIIKTKEGKTYKACIREASYYLQNLGVSQANVSEAIQKVTKAVTGKDMDSLPSYASQNTFTKEMKAISRQQVKEALTDQTNTTLKYDGTTKKLGHLVEVEVATKDRTYLMGICQQLSGKATDYVSSIKPCVDNIENTGNSDTTENRGLLKSMKNTMTDRCKTNDAIDDLLALDTGVSVNRFKCAMHPLDTFAKDCDKVIKIYECKHEVNEKKKTCEYPLFTGGKVTHKLWYALLPNYFMTPNTIVIGNW